MLFSGSMKTKIYVPLSVIVKVLGLPTSYVRKLAEQHKIPALKIKGHFRFNAEAVKIALDDLASKGGSDDDIENEK